MTKDGGRGKSGCEIDWNEWQGPRSPLGKIIDAENEATLAAYEAQPRLVREHANQERSLVNSGYRERQVVELTQNSADAMPGKGGSVRVALTEDALYFADDGTPIDDNGVITLLHAHLSDKGGSEQIGRFGLGFKSLLRVSEEIEFYSRSGSFRFNREWSREKIMEVPGVEDIVGNGQTPIMRLAKPIGARAYSEHDPRLRQLMAGHNNVVKAFINVDPEASFANLAAQLRGFPVEFLLLTDKIGQMVFRDVERSAESVVSVTHNGELRYLDVDGSQSPWYRFEVEHDLSPTALQDRRSLNASEKTRVGWVVPANGSRGPSQFWAHFPTKEPCLISGIVNAHWNTNDDRTGLTPGTHNDELLEVAARLCADKLPEVKRDGDPGFHLEILPRRQDVGDRPAATQLRRSMYGHLHTREIVPDRAGKLRKPDEISYPPREMLPFGRDSQARKAYELWLSSDFAPSDALLASAATTERWVKVEQLNDPLGRRARGGGAGAGASHPTLGEWLERLTRNRARRDAPFASRDAIKVAAELPPEMRVDSSDLGLICLTQAGEWRKPSEVSLPLDATYGGPTDGILVHQDVASDSETVEALRALGVNEISSLDLLEEELRALNELRDAIGNRRRSGEQSDRLFGNVWNLARPIPVEDAVRAVKAVPRWRSTIRARTVGGDWAPIEELLLPGGVFADGQARQLCVDVDYHRSDIELICALGVTDGPKAMSLDDEPWQEHHAASLRDYYRGESHPGGKTPQAHLIHIIAKDGVGPLTPFHSAYLTDRDVAAYTDAVLRLPEAFAAWTVAHSNRTDYSPIAYDGMAANYLVLYGKLNLGSGRIVGLRDISEKDEASVAALRQYRTWPLIRRLLRLPESDGASGDYEAIQPDAGNLITDRWPAAEALLGRDRVNANVVLCDAIAYQGAVDRGHLSFRDGDDVYVVRDEDERTELGNALRELGIVVNDHELEQALHHEDRAVREARRRVRDCDTDEGKLLEAVGADVLMLELPELLTDYADWKDESLEGVEIARAAIATYHTGVLKRYRRYIGHLDPPRQWAGGRPIREFIAELGFPPDWAGAPRRREDPYEDVLGPFTLPDLHEYQQRIVDVIRAMATQPRGKTNRRALVSLPTGAGKTRVAVQAIVEAMRDGFEGEVLWVADRRELLEQAVESWQQVWRCIGPERGELRISRVYDGQPMPTETTGSHVIVASIQTLYSRFGGQSNPEPLSRVRLVVLDEAHHAIAPTYTALMDTLGFGAAGSGRGPILLGLTATPYRGMNAEETRRLVNRFERNRLDRVAFDGLIDDDPEEVIRYLQDHDPRVLAIARHMTIDGDQIILDASEAAQAAEFPWLPDSAERRLAQSAERTDRILDAYEREIKSKSEDWPTLIFATSVEHAQTLAAELTLRGTKARSVSSETESSTRRRIVEEYRNGEVKVLVNYGVFREGFDAPKTRAVIIARPAFSANLYFQMIGRGLRGPANGGNPDCLVIDVEDNIINFKGRLAFTELEDFWDR